MQFIQEVKKFIYKLTLKLFKMSSGQLGMIPDGPINEPSILTPGTEHQTQVHRDEAADGLGRYYGKRGVSGFEELIGDAASSTGLPVQSGVYTPTLTNGVNIDSSVAYQCQWMRVGNVVTVSGQVDMNINTTLLFSSLRMSLPIPSNILALNNLGGVASGAGNSQTTTVAIRGAAATNDAQFAWAGQVNSADTLNYFFSFTYLIQP